ncbi:MAG: HAD family hydrolase [Candidatus Helarchaeota archaeon]
MTTNKKKIGIIFSDLEGTLTKEISFWKKINAEMGMTEAEDQNLYEDFIKNPSTYPQWMEKIYRTWKKRKSTFSAKFNKKFFENFSKTHLKIYKGAANFIQKCKKNFIFFVISGAPPIFCRFAQEQLQFDNFYSTSHLLFDKNEILIGIRGDPNGFYKERIMNRIAKSQDFEKKQIIALGDSENDITMLNAAGLGILIGLNLTFPSFQDLLAPHVVHIKELDYDKIYEIIEQYQSSII